MKPVHVCHFVFVITIAVAGCGESNEGASLANEGVTADQIAQYEAELAAVSGDDAYADTQDGDDSTGDTGDDAGGDAGGDASEE